MPVQLATGVMVGCVTISVLPNIGIPMKDLKPSDAVIRGMSGLDLQNCGCNLHCDKQEGQV